MKVIRRRLCAALPLALGVARRDRRQRRRTAAPRSTRTATLKLPENPQLFGTATAVGRQGDRDRQRRGHHPDRHRPAPGAAGDRQRRHDPGRRNRAPAPAGAAQPDRRNAADPGRQGRRDRDHRCGHRQDGRARRRQCEADARADGRLSEGQRLLDPLDPPPDPGRNRLAPPAERRRSRAASASATKK